MQRITSQHLDGTAIRNLSRGDSREAIPNQFARSDSQKHPYFMTFERFVRITVDLRFADFDPLKRDSQKKNDSHESGDSRKSANRFARLGPSKSQQVETQDF